MIDPHEGHMAMPEPLRSHVPDHVVRPDPREAGHSQLVDEEVDEAEEEPRERERHAEA